MTDNTPNPPSPPPPQSSPPPPPPPVPPPWMFGRPRRISSIGQAIVTATASAIFLISIVLNVILLAGLGAKDESRFKQTVVHKGKDNQVIALYSLNGIIDEAMARRFETFCDEVTRDGNVKAVLLRVNSPGGGVSPSDRICELVKRLKTEGGKKVVVSMGNVAASGGYYISVPADEIVAEPTTVTGSIGVLMVWLVVEGTLEKIGADVVVMKSTHAAAWKDEVSFLRPPAPYQREHLQQILDALQQRFEDVVREGRGDRLKTRQVDRTVQGPKGKPIKLSETEPMNGKVYLADEALKLGMIDHKGHLELAVKRAQALASLAEPKLIRYEPRKPFVEKLMEARGAAGLQLDAKLLDKLQTPEIMMIWKAE